MMLLQEVLQLLKVHYFPRLERNQLVVSGDIHGIRMETFFLLLEKRQLLCSWDERDRTGRACFDFCPILLFTLRAIIAVDIDVVAIALWCGFSWPAEAE